MKRALFSLFLIPALLFNSSCKDECAEEYDTDVEDELTTVIAAALAYSLDPSSANCTAYKNATQAYIDVLRNYVDCDGFSSGEKDQLEQDLEDAEAELSTLPC